MTDQNPQNPQDSSQPIFNVPFLLLLMAFFLVAVHFAFETVLDNQGKFDVVLWFGFWPLRFWESGMPGGQGALVWSFVTHAFLHGSWSHVILNTLWMVIFGTPVARRFGNVPFLVVFLGGAAVGAATFALTQGMTQSVLIGASGGVAALTGLALRFMFQPTVMLKDPITEQLIPVGKKMGTISTLWTEQRARWFTIIWLGMNLAFAAVSLFTGVQVAIAWQAHIGGFVFGVLIADFLPKTPLDRLIEKHENGER